MPRNLVPRAVTKFRGIKQAENVRSVAPDYAVDCRNVIVGNLGYLEKVRYPADLSTVDAGIELTSLSFFSQAAAALRKVVLVGDNGSIYVVDTTTWVATIVDTNPLNTGVWDAVTSNNIQFLSNGARSLKYLGAAGLRNWGIPIPVAAPQLGFTWHNAVFIRNAGSVAVTIFPQAGEPYVLTVTTGDLLSARNCVDPSFNGDFTATTTGVPVWAQADADAATTGDLTIFATQSIIGFTSFQRSAGVAILTVGLVTLAQGGDSITVKCADDPTFDIDLAPVISVTTVGFVQEIRYAQALPDVPLTVSVGVNTYEMGPNSSAVYGWAYSYKSSITGDEGTASPVAFMPDEWTASWFNTTAPFILAAPSIDPLQVDTIVWYRTYGGGGDLFYHSEHFIPTDGYLLVDKKADAELNPTIRASYINDPPPAGKYLCQFQGRIFIAGIPGAPQDIAFTGYDKILVGRPETVCPPRNRIRLAIGADAIRGIGAFQYGVVAFDQSNHMFLFRGTVEDITLDAPINFSFTLEQLPWQEGANSHYSIQSTSHGLIWWASDLNVKVFTGLSKPKVISAGVSGYLQRRTAGQEANARSFFFNYADRDWYALLFAYNGSAVNNLCIVFDMEVDEEDNVGTFIIDVGQIDAIGVVEDQNGARKLVITQAGVLREIHAITDAIGGVDQGTRPATANQLAAWWASGYFGGTNILVRNFFRFGRLLTSQPGEFGLVATLIDGERYTPQSPQLKALLLDNGGSRFSINTKSGACSIQVVFPSLDANATVLELSLAHHPLAYR